MLSSRASKSDENERNGKGGGTSSRRLSHRPQGLSSRISLSSSESSVPLLNFFCSPGSMAGLQWAEPGCGSGESRRLKFDWAAQTLRPTITGIFPVGGVDEISLERMQEIYLSMAQRQTDSFENARKIVGSWGRTHNCGKTGRSVPGMENQSSMMRQKSHLGSPVFRPMAIHYRTRQAGE